MKIAIIGYGKEGKANEEYFRGHRDETGLENEIEVIDPYRDEDYEKYDFSQYDLILRSPSVRPRPGFSSGTQYFFDHCPAPIIGVTGTKGKGTTCSMITQLLEALGKKVFLVGNIGIPAISKLEEIREAVFGGEAQEDLRNELRSGSRGNSQDDLKSDKLDKSRKDVVVVYELSSFQLWDLTKSPHIAVVLRIAPDHLNVHKDFEEYVAAKARICKFQGSEDKVVYFRDNAESRAIAERSRGEKIPYPVEKPSTRLREVLDALKVPGEHNRENAEAALLAVAAFLGVELEELLEEYFEELREGLSNFKGLPHHIEFVKELNGVSYYDDSFSTAEPALEVAVKAFPGRPLVLIAGGQDKGVDLTETKRLIFGAEGLKKVFLIGEIAEKLAEGEDMEKYEVVGSLEEAVTGAQKVAENYENAVVLMSPGAASLDMFESYYARGDEFQGLVKGLK